MADALAVLKSQKIWVIWFKKIKPDGRIDKKPRSAANGGTVPSPEYSATWVTFDEATRGAQKFGADGVEFVLPRDFSFLDIDHRELTDPLTQKLLDRFDSYTEASFSGTGYHVYGKCDPTRIPQYIDDHGKTKLDRQFYTKNPHNEVELYFGGITNHFAVYTGKVIRDVPLRECTEAALTTLDKDMRKKQKIKYSEKRSISSSASENRKTVRSSSSCSMTATPPDITLRLKRTAPSAQ